MTENTAAETLNNDTARGLLRIIEQLQKAARSADSYIDYLQAKNQALEAENAHLRAAYTRRTQLALAAGMVRFIVTGDKP